MKRFGFDASALTRTALGIVFIAASVVLVLIIERPSHEEDRIDLAPVIVGSAKKVWPVTIESTFPVVTWSIRVSEVEQVATHHDAYSWSGTIPAASGDELLVHAQAAETDGSPNHGLRLLIGSAPERLVWSGGDVTATAEFTL